MSKPTQEQVEAAKSVIQILRSVPHTFRRIDRIAKFLSRRDAQIEAMQEAVSAPTRTGETVTEELKPCPFCGGKPELRRPNGYWVECLCGAEKEVCDEPLEAIDAAIRAGERNKK